jgi:hypothetical protein
MGIVGELARGVFIATGGLIGVGLFVLTMSAIVSVLI